jgi:hypothetical protein
MWRTMAGHAMRFLAAPAITDGLGYDTGGLLLTEREFIADPVHITIVGGKTVPERRSSSPPHSAACRYRRGSNGWITAKDPRRVAT